MITLSQAIRDLKMKLLACVFAQASQAGRALMLQRRAAVERDEGTIRGMFCSQSSDIILVLALSYIVAQASQAG